MTDLPWIQRRRSTGVYQIVDRETGEDLGVVKRDRTIRSFAVWDAFKPDGEWVLGFPTLTWAARTLWRRFGDS